MLLRMPAVINILWIELENMKIGMDSDICYRIGSSVSCTTTFGQTLEGEVTAYDQATQLLILKCPSTSGRVGHHNVHILNLDCVTKVAVVREPLDGQVKGLNSINLNKLAKRVQMNIEAKMRQVEYVRSGVSPVAQNLVHAITKTITDVRWEGENIVVMDVVIISPPYTVDSCQGTEGSAALNHVKKLVEKFYREVSSVDASTPSST